MYEQTGSNSSASTLIYYDEKSRPAELYYTTSYLVGNVNTVSETTHKNTYDNEGKLTKYKVSEGSTSYSFMPTYDDFGRVNYKMNVLQTSSSSLSSMVDYEYSTNEQYTRWESTQVSKYVWSLGSNISEYNYVYDDNGNIIQIKDDDGVIQHRFEYDILGQLIREDNRPLGKSYLYGYDKAGNRISLSEGVFSLGTVTVTSTQNYGYNNASWGDQITSINGDTVTYDPMGNPLTYYIDGLDSVLTWTNGRQLASYENMDGLRTYTYNDEGIRISRTVSGVEHKYQLNGTQIVSETWGIHTIFFVYDENGSIAGMRYRTSSYAEGVFDEYYFEKNLQGDVVAIYNVSGTKLVNYTYDAWGKVTTTYTNSGASTGARYNPFRYRGYYYDDDTGLYYLNSRYYDPCIGRFINADSVMSDVGNDIQGYNLFAYCFNNPVNMDDSIGRWPKWLTGALNVVGGSLQMAAGAALGATVGWTGVGAVIAGFLVVNGSATIVQGVGRISNDITNTDYMREDNIIRTGVQEVGRTIGGDSGAEMAAGVYDIATVAATLYAGAASLADVINKKMPQILNSKLFSHNGGWGYKIGKSIEMFYRNPNAAGGPGGTIFSYNGIFGKFRIDWDPLHGFHMHPPGHK